MTQRKVNCQLPKQARIETNKSHFLIRGLLQNKVSTALLTCQQNKKKYLGIIN